MTVLPLTSENLSSLAPGVATPVYDRSRVRVGMVHLGVGGFHRAHQAMYLDRLMNDGQAQDWAICGVGVLPSDRLMADVLAAQDHLYTLVIKHPDGSLEPRVIGSLVDYLYAPDDPEAVLDRLADPATRIVTLTVTEGGYNIHPVTGRFEGTTTPSGRICAREPSPARPSACSPKPWSGGGTGGSRPSPSSPATTSRGTVTSPVAACPPSRTYRPRPGGLGRPQVAFPNTMVDRITPVTTDDDRRRLADIPCHRSWPVVCEPFTAWVLEDGSPCGAAAGGRGRRPGPGRRAVRAHEAPPAQRGPPGVAYLGYLLGTGSSTRRSPTLLFARFLAPT